MSRLTVFAVTGLLAVVAAAGIAVAASAPTSPATVKTRSTSLGKVLVNGKSVTLYLFEKDKNGKSACSGACAKAWPPALTKGKPKASGDAVASKLGTTKRSDGTTQVTYNKHPLYTFIKDANKAGRTTGEGVDAFGAEWYVVGTNGRKIEKKGS
jgi:predicted lipoprotein with Yx(FWY)xxD motif